MRTLTEHAAAVAAREVSPVELVEKALKDLEHVETVTNAFTHVLPDQALARAKELEAIDPIGPLHGVPVAVKELYDVQGLPTTGCCAALDGRVPQSDSAVVERLRAAGAIVMTKTNQHEMACGATNLLSSFGPVRNPWDLERIPGGSSGGSAAAVAAGVVAMAMGSDTGGSVRIPSSFCGVTGLKSTHGAVSLLGAMPCVPSLDTAGPLAASARDCALVFEVISGFDSTDLWSRPRPAQADTRPVAGMRIAILRRFCALAHPEMRRGVEEAGRVLESLGAIVEEIDGPDPDEAWEAGGPIFATEFAASYPELAEDNRASREVRSLLKAGNRVRGTVYAKSIAAGRAASRRFDAAFSAADVLLAPTTPYPAPRAETEEVDIGGRTIDVRSGGPARLTMPINIAGLPALALPVGFSSENLPLGGQLIGPQWSEAQLCAVGAAVQEATDWHLRTPPV